MSPTEREAGELLRARGLRSTPQRRAILGVFEGGRTEHLSADEVYALAVRTVPELSRGTVYATLAEFTEAGLLASFGRPEPVRYETNTGQHDHFLCRICLRTFDLAINPRARETVKQRGFRIERIEIRAEGVCEECADYERGLKAGAREITRSAAEAQPGIATAEMESPLGPLLLSATAEGIVRVAFPEHADAEQLRSRTTRRGSPEARRQLREGVTQLEGYFAGTLRIPVPKIDWGAIDPGAIPALKATLEIPYGEQRSYADLGVPDPPREIGHVMGANPIPIITPCHRVIRGIETPNTYVGGSQRRQWLNEHERRHTSPQSS